MVIVPTWRWMDNGTFLYSFVIMVIKTNNPYRKKSMSQVHYIHHEINWGSGKYFA
jgi:hypothetical protein